jgi:Fe-S-cluster containining protein
MKTVAIDPQLSRLAYRCFPNGCPRGRTCCVGLIVEVSRREMRVVDSLMDELARVAPGLRRGSGFVNVFTDDGDGLQIEPQDEAGTCPFLFGRKGRALCAIHDTALRTDREVAAVKPRACRHWPLVLEAHGRRLRITVHPSAERMGCVAPLAELPGQPTVRAAFAAEIAELRRLAAG